MTRRNNSSFASKRSLLGALLIGALLTVVGVFISEYSGSSGTTQEVTAQASSIVPPVAATSAPDWTVGELRPNGLRIKPSGRNDASQVLDPAQFMDAEVRNSYRIAREIPEVLNKLYCWCGCENRGVHRSNLGCFEDMMGVNCAVCRGTAEIAYDMVRGGTTDAGEIQAAVDAEWGRA